MAPGAYVAVTGEGVPEGMPDEIKLSGGTPFVPVGTGVDADDPEAVKTVPDPEAEPAADKDELGDAPTPGAVVRGAAGAADAA